MRDTIKEYEAVAKAAENFVKSVAEGNSSYAKQLLLTTRYFSAYLTVCWSMVQSNSSTIMSIPSEPATISKHALMSLL